MRAVDDVVMAAIRAAGVTLEDGFFRAPAEPGVPVRIDTPLPYAVYYSSIGDEHNPRLDGRRRRGSVFFSVTYVGIDRNQTKAAGERIRRAISGVRFAVSGHRTWPVQLQQSQRVRRDDGAVNPEGHPLFYGVDDYDLSLTINNQPAGV